MWDLAGRVCIVFNGEIFNFRELRMELIRDGYRFKGKSDTEVILNLYLRDGCSSFCRLNGMFAFALWDPVLRELIIVRDGMGVKPLYFSETSEGVVFASELKALTRVRGVDRSLDHTALSHYLTYLHCPAPRTPVLGIKKVSPGTILKVRDGRLVSSEKFWTRPVAFGVDSRSVPEMSEELEMLLSRAVKRQMISDVPVGAFLSGGLDSSSIAVFARQFSASRELRCFSIGFNEAAGFDGFSDDLPYARRVAEHLSVPLEVIWCGSEISQDFGRMIYHLDEPLADPAALHVWKISKLAKESGVSVLLSGCGGDDLFGGYRRHYALQLERWWSWLPVAARRWLESLSGSFSRDRPSGRRFAKAFRYAASTEDRRIAGYFSWLAESEVRKLFSRDIRRSLSGADFLRPLLDQLRELPTELPPLAKMLQLDQSFFLTDHNLNYTDKMAMAAGVEVRVPFLDPDLMSFAADIPVRLKQRRAVGKWIFKKAMEVHLPKDVIYRGKSGFGAPLRRWLQRELKYEFEQCLSPCTIRKRGVFDLDSVMDLVARDREGLIDASYSLFAVMCIESWCREFID
jgi:asparagine synthase (glutamine-hydrolysing)